ncbi:MAG: GAF and ANTAR domain-containing protein [Nocardioidaceae bacterium]|nr:GAF and ANTAR domain-containing protein [Nocardioidaceae bacterium]
MIDQQELGTFFVEAAGALVGDVDVVDFLHTVADRVSRISGTDAVGLGLADHHDRLLLLASSDGDGTQLELVRLGLEEGPGRDCHRTGAAVVHHDLPAAADRWPGFVAAALAGGCRSVHAVPLRLRNEAVGAMGLFGRDDEPFADEDVQVVQAVADVATIGILQDRALRRAEELGSRLQHALDDRILVEQARGVVVVVAGVDVAEALTLLRDHGCRHGLHLAAVARAVLDDPHGTAAWWRS